MARFVISLHLSSHTGLNARTTHQKHPTHVLPYPLCVIVYSILVSSCQAHILLLFQKTFFFFLLKLCFVAFHYMQNLINRITGGQQMFR